MRKYYPDLTDEEYKSALYSNLDTILNNLDDDNALTLISVIVISIILKIVLLKNDK